MVDGIAIQQHGIQNLAADNELTKTAVLFFVTIIGDLIPDSVCHFFLNVWIGDLSFFQ